MKDSKESLTSGSHFNTSTNSCCRYAIDCYCPNVINTISFFKYSRVSSSTWRCLMIIMHSCNRDTTFGYRHLRHIYTIICHILRNCLNRTISHIHRTAALAAA